ncbi:hypothetical protein B0T17DRAFT_531569 [Bombardia bombarda]|uniref:Protein kinase domain-containing protein n=1 Tax=Bombardia bombarda TaxID=252184 RepID=A0AA39X0D5_9PEZI|nr:hypothetical protein B0T17DRAFT_531569 [Bombardia bombarda]
MSFIDFDTSLSEENRARLKWNGGLQPKDLSATMLTTDPRISANFEEQPESVDRNPFTEKYNLSETLTYIPSCTRRMTRLFTRAGSGIAIKMHSRVEYRDNYSNSHQGAAIVDRVFPLIAPENGLDSNDYSTVSYEIMSLVGCLHQTRILHRDINPDSIGRNEEGQAVFHDFRLAHKLGAGSEDVPNWTEWQMFLPPRYCEQLKPGPRGWTESRFKMTEKDDRYAAALTILWVWNGLDWIESRKSKSALLQKPLEKMPDLSIIADDYIRYWVAWQLERGGLARGNQDWPDYPQWDVDPHSAEASDERRRRRKEMQAKISERLKALTHTDNDITPLGENNNTTLKRQREESEDRDEGGGKRRRMASTAPYGSSGCSQAFGQLVVA